MDEPAETRESSDCMGLNNGVVNSGGGRMNSKAGIDILALRVTDD